jgi:DNA-binding transcriptional regulator YdaS (Cro superfamily)
MKLKPFLFAMPMGLRVAFAERCGTTYGHIRNVSYGQKACAPELAINIERESGGAVRCEELRPDVDWAYLRRSRAKRKEAA